VKKNPDWAAMLQAINAKWYYTWSSDQAEMSPAGIEFIPMQWGRWGCTAEKMTRLKARHDTILGFNEPDQHEQANMSIEEALALWPILMESGMRLGSPAAVHPDGEWMTVFMEESARRGYRIDFINMHSYMGKNSKHFLNKVERIYKRYKKPIWITEFAVADWDARADKPNKFSPDDAYEFMEKALPELEKTDYVERYAWFTSPTPSLAVAPSVLFNEDGSLNRLGRLYASI